MNYINVLLTSEVFQTIISGVIVFLLGECLLNFFIKPYLRYKELRGEAAATLMYYANAYSKVISADMQKTATEELRKISSKYVAFAIEGNRLFVPSKKTLNKVANGFAFLSNSVASEDFQNVREKQAEIRELINIAE